MAVFPVPGSPTSTGLFFVLRAKMRITLRISSSRPITGSNFPSAARDTNSLPNLFKAESSFATAAALIGSESQVRTASALPSALSKIETSCLSPEFFIKEMSKCPGSALLPCSARTNLTAALNTPDKSLLGWLSASVLSTMRGNLSKIF